MSGTAQPTIQNTTNNAGAAGGIERTARLALGRRADWRIPAPDLRALRPGAALLGPLLMVASVLVGWFAFAGATGEEGGSVALGLFVGAGAIVLMAWSFLLAVRIRVLEPFFGGLDRIYQAHRWAGTLSVLLMFLHVRLEPEVEGGILGASKAVAETAEGLAGVGEYMIYGLVAISLIRWFPYRFWRLTHKLLGIPFAFASWHFFTAEKTYANNSAWGWYFGSIMVTGLAAFLWRVVGRDMLVRGRRHRVAATRLAGSTLEVELAPVRRKLDHQAGQFAVLKFQERGLSEPHVFTIASSPDAEHLRFFIRDLGDWTGKLLHRDLVGTEVIVEGPYGRFEPLSEHGGQALWVAGGVGITPFLSAIDSLDGANDEPPVLVYCVPSRADATAIDELERADAEGRIRLEVMASDEGRRFSPDRLVELVGRTVHASADGRPLRGVHVAACGPQGLVRDAARTARSLGADGVETEAFDIRSGVGPDLSRPVDEKLGELIGSSTPAAAGS